ncbi:MAG: S-layer homology domain-containing protein [Flavonifractor plautii]
MRRWPCDLVRAMQLAPLAQSLTSYPMSFADTTSISASLQPYVYLLNMYGIVKGNELNRFLPQNSLTRAEMATMLRRAIDFMDERGIYAELPGYTDYDWVGGTIAAVSTGSSGITLLTLTSVVSGTRSISLPADAEIYENNMLSSADTLKVGSYARVNLDRKGTAESVRLGGAVTSIPAPSPAWSRTALTVTVNGASKRLDIDRFTGGAGERDRRRLHPAGSPGRIHHGPPAMGRHGPSGRGAALRRNPRRGGHTGEGGKRHRRPAAPGVGL